MKRVVRVGEVWIDPDKVGAIVDSDVRGLVTVYLQGTWLEVQLPYRGTPEAWTATDLGYYLWPDAEKGQVYPEDAL